MMLMDIWKHLGLFFPQTFQTILKVKKWLCFGHSCTCWEGGIRFVPCTFTHFQLIWVVCWNHVIHYFQLLINIFRNDVMCPFCISHYVNVYSNALVSSIKSNDIYLKKKRGETFMGVWSSRLSYCIYNWC